MRLWLDPKGSLVDDQRLLAYISSHGSLSEAAKDGDFVLLSDAQPTEAERLPIAKNNRKSRRLADFLEG